MSEPRDEGYERYDVVSFGETMLRLTPPDATRLEETRALAVYVAGAESNTLVALARLGLRVAWLSALPMTPPGRLVEGELRRLGVDTRYVVWDGRAEARLGLYYAEEAAAPLGAQVYYDRAGSALATLDPDRVDVGVVQRARLLYLTGITPALGARAREAWDRLRAAARLAGAPLCLDINYRARLWGPEVAAEALDAACQEAATLICARADARTLWGFDGDARETLGQMARRFGAGGRYVLTLGAEGAAQLDDGVYRSVPALPTTGMYRFGSGDAFAAGYVSAWLAGEAGEALGGGGRPEPLEPLAVGVALAALKRCIPGDMAVVSAAELAGALRQEGEGRFR